MDVEHRHHLMILVLGKCVHEECHRRISTEMMCHPWSDTGVDQPGLGVDDQRLGVDHPRLDSLVDVAHETRRHVASRRDWQCGRWAGELTEMTWSMLEL